MRQTRAILPFIAVALSALALWLIIARPAAAKTISIPLRSDVPGDQHLTVNLSEATRSDLLNIYAELTGRRLISQSNSISENLDDVLGGRLSRFKLIHRRPIPDSGVRLHRDGVFTAEEVKAAIELHLRTNGFAALPVGAKGFRIVRSQ